VAAQAFDVGDVVAGVGASAECRTADVDRVSAMVDGGDTDVGVAGWGEEFEGKWGRHVESVQRVTTQSSQDSSFADPVKGLAKSKKALQGLATR
jgi:glycerate-2-kinase